MSKLFLLINKIPKTYFIFFYLLSLPILTFLPYVVHMKRALLFSISGLFLYILIIEILFRMLYRVICKRAYVHIPRLPFSRMYVEPHPYLPYVYKKNFLCHREMPVTYPLHRDREYMFAQVFTNNFRHVNGPEGGRDIEVPKPERLIRVNCLGASTTGNYIRYNNQNYSYPMELEKTLKGAFPGLNIEVNNCGQGGYTSAEILIKFLLDTIDTKPDIVVIYHAYNDLEPSLTADFQSDYSHAKRNLGEIYYLYRLVSKIPDIPLESWNFLLNYCLFSQNIGFNLLKVVSRGTADIKNDFKGLGTYRRNIEHIINICKANGVHVIASTFCQYLYPEVKNDKVYLRYFEGGKLENQVMRELAKMHNLPLVDNEYLIPQEDKYFVDTVHFTPEGMQLLARNISHPIIEYINKNA